MSSCTGFPTGFPANIPPKQWLKELRGLVHELLPPDQRRQRLQREALVEILLRAEQKQSPTLSEGPIRRALDGCCEKLSPESQRLLALRYEQELPSHVIAERLQSTAEAVRCPVFGSATR